ncbi:glycosyltransferase [Leptolyngbya sp. FACHB-17]|nr:glycosyltransferase [Leptolyngbya sp. FACHB-17]MBD2079351.1 glycosyltransferase [Leptolyngbya sp. FACHB-17]
MPTVTIGFFPREQFSLAAESLQRIFDCTHIPFDLVVIDCNTPKIYWKQIAHVLEKHNNVRVLHTDDYLMPNQSRNLVIQESNANNDFLCFIESDVLVEDGWLSYLIQACEDYPADVAIPRIIEGRLGATQVHWDPNLGQVHTVQTMEGIKLEILPPTGDQQLDQGTHRRSIELSGEAHCQLYRRSVFDRVTPFDEDIVYLDWFDSTMALYDAKIPIVFEPKATVHFWHPFPPDTHDLDFFFRRWNLQQANQEFDHVQKKWNLVRITADLFFVEERNRIGHLYDFQKELEALSLGQKPFILVDQDCLNGNKITEGFQTIPFTELNGQYWGVPADDDMAIREFERLRQAGVSAIVFLWTTFWWLEHFARFHDYLRKNFSCILENDRIIVFNLR